MGWWGDLDSASNPSHDCSPPWSDSSGHSGLLIEIDDPVTITLRTRHRFPALSEGDPGRCPGVWRGRTARVTRWKRVWKTVSVLAVLVLVEHMVEVTRYYTITAAT